MANKTKFSHVNNNRLRRFTEQSEPSDEPSDQPIENLVVIGTSAGGHKALRAVLKGLSNDIPAAIIITTHMGETNGTKTQSFRFEDWLRFSTNVPIQGIKSGDRLQQGMIYVTPGGQSVVIRGHSLHIENRNPEPPLSTIDILFESAAQEFRERVIGVILTGLLKDGTAGLKAVHDAGGVTIVQDPVEAEYPDMPTNAMEGMPVTFCIGSTDIGLALDILTRRTMALETGTAVSVRILKERVALLARLLAQSYRNPDTCKFIVTELTSLECDLRSIQDLATKAMVSATPYVEKLTR